MGNVTLPLHQWITALRNVRSEMPDDFAYQRNLIREVDSVINQMMLGMAANAAENARGVAIPAPSINDLAREACAALATVHYDHMGKVCADVERCFDAAKALYAAPPASVMVVPTTDTDMRGGIADYLCAAGLDMKLAEDMALDLMRYIRTGVWGDVGAKGG